MREVISIHIGQAGIQLGNTCWELYCLEHGIHPDGRLSSDTSVAADEDNTYDRFFSETGAGKHVPRALFLDLEPTVINEIRSGEQRHLYQPEQLISGNEGTQHDYHRGYTAGNQIIEHCVDRIRKLSENCTKLQGFLVFNAVGGGTGSGFATLLSQRLAAEYRKETKLAFTIYPDFPADSTEILTSEAAPAYNSVLSTHSLLEHIDVTVVLQNKAVKRICKSSLGIEMPTFMNLNRLMSQTISSLTTCLRFDGALNGNLMEFQYNLVPYHRIQFMLASYAPFGPLTRPFDEQQLTVKQMTENALFQKSSMMANCNLSDGKHVACCLMYRGDAGAIIKDVGEFYNTLGFSSRYHSQTPEDRMAFVDWKRMGFACGIHYQPPTVVPGGELAKAPRSVCLISNNTVVGQIFSRINRKIDQLYSSGGDLQYVRERLDETFGSHEAREDLVALETEYAELISDQY